MLLNYCKLAFRNLKKHKVFSFINVAGLAVGLATFCLIALYITDELSFDRYHANASRIVRVAQTGQWQGGSFKLAPTPVPMGPALQKDYPEVQAFARVDPEGGGTILQNNQQYKTADIIFADNALFQVFGWRFLAGDPAQALTKPQAIVLNKTLAVKLFGSVEDALNKTVVFANDQPSTVTGVIADVPVNSHFSFSAVRSFNTNFNDSWKNSYLYTYLLLRNAADRLPLEAKLDGFFKRYMQDDASAGGQFHLLLQPLTSIHLYSHLDYELGNNGNITYVWIFACIALLILAIAIINYVNLATARASIRMKEIGVRKVIGSGKRQIILQFLTEAVLLTALATVLAALIIYFALPYFNYLSGKSLVMLRFGGVTSVLAFLGFALLTGVVSGLYPALFLANFQAIPAMKGLWRDQSSTIFFRKSLVTFQFVITIAMIGAAGIIYQQLHYVLHKDLGFNKEQVLSFHIANKKTRESLPALKAQLLKNPLIAAASAASNPIGNNAIGTLNFLLETEKGGIDVKSTVAQHFMIDPDYLQTLQIRLREGRNFSASMPTDSSEAVLVNETLVKEAGWQTPIGKHLKTAGGKERTVIGVVKDFNIYSLQHKIAPLVLLLPPVAKEEDNLYVRVDKKQAAAAVKYIESVYHTFEPGNDFEYTFLDQNFAQQYDTEERQGSILTAFTLIATGIAFLGLFGLVTFTVEQRTKEIGIRKVLGSSVGAIVGMLSKDFIQLVLIAVCIATPLAWWGMHQWLEGFAYSVQISGWLFAGAGAFAMLIALATVCLRAMKAAMVNPVKSLRAE